MQQFHLIQTRICKYNICKVNDYHLVSDLVIPCGIHLSPHRRRLETDNDKFHLQEDCNQSLRGETGVEVEVFKCKVNIWWMWMFRIKYYTVNIRTCLRICLLELAFGFCATNKNKSIDSRHNNIHSHCSLLITTFTELQWERSVTVLWVFKLTIFKFLLIKATIKKIIDIHLFIYNDIKQKKIANIHFWETGTRKYVYFYV